MCDSQSCPESAQLCVDASFFVPMMQDNVYVYYLDFTNVSAPSIDSKSTKQISTSADDSQTITWTIKSANATIAKVSAVYESNHLTGSISKKSTVIEGANVHVAASDMLIRNGNDTMDSGFLNLSNNLSLKANPANQELIYDVILNGDTNNVIFGITFTAAAWDNAKNYVDLSSLLALTAGSKKTYPNEPNMQLGFNPPANATSTNVPFPIPQFIASCDDAVNTSDGQDLAMNIVNANLLLQLRANKNVLNAGADVADPEDFPAGDYDVCVSFKDCEGDFANLNVFRITIKQDRTIVGKWGKDTTKSGSLIADKHDSAILKTALYKADVSVSGSLNGVFNNTNDFVVCIEKVVQLFPLVGSGNLIQISSDTVTAEFNTQHEEYPFLFAALANTKLYLSIKYIVAVPDDNQDDPVKKAHQMCKGQLNPFDNTKSVSRPGYTFIKGYTIAEITNMMDHPVMQSNLSREITLCISSEDVLASNAAN